MEEHAIEHAVARVRAGDREAFREVVAKAAVPLRAYVRFFLNDPEVADDLVQDVFVNAFQEINRYQLGTDFMAWLKALARNEALARRRSQERKLSAHKRYCRELMNRVSSEALRREEASPIETLSAIIRRCLAELSQRVRSLVLLRYYQGMSVERAAKEAGFNPGAAGTALHRARQALAACMERRSS